MRELRPSQQGQKGHGERSKTGEKFLQGALPTDGQAYEQHEEVDDLVLSKASWHQMHLLGEGLQHGVLGEILCDEDDFGKKGEEQMAFPQQRLGEQYPRVAQRDAEGKKQAIKRGRVSDESKEHHFKKSMS
jgi:hypothetical protein